MGRDENYQRLAIAIVKQAADDWKWSAKILRKNPRNARIKAFLNETERFFRSTWCYELGGVDGSYILRRLQEELGK